MLFCVVVKQNIIALKKLLEKLKALKPKVVVPEVVETSSNLAIIHIEGGKASIAILARSSCDSMKLYLCNSLLTCFSMAGMKVKFEGGYGGWQPNTKSPLVAEMSAVSRR